MKRVILLSVSILLISLAYSFAEVPCKINYQGRLIKDNVPVDGTKTMVFSIYAVATGDSPIWTSGNVNVEVHNGLFRYVLDLSSIDWTAGQELYLEVIVDGETLTPREELYAYPYAINSHLLEGKTTDYFLNTSGEEQTKDGGLNIMGNVGIGTADPQGYKLYVAGDILSSTGKFYNVDKNDYIEIRASDESIRFFTQNAEKLTILNSGNVGIGTTSPQAKLDVQGNLRVGQYTLPSVDGQPSQVLSTDGNGNLSWVNMGGGFGDWVDMSAVAAPGDYGGLGPVQGPALSDGIVCGVGYGNGSYPREDYTNSSNPPTTLRTVGNYPNAGNPDGLTMPVKKGDYWRIKNVSKVYWLPLGN